MPIGCARVLEIVRLSYSRYRNLYGISLLTNYNRSSPPECPNKTLGWAFLPGDLDRSLCLGGRERERERERERDRPVHVSWRAYSHPDFRIAE